jgi:hypothetical protein
MGARNGGRPAVALVAITALLASVVVLSVTAGAKRRVILYGDSLAFEARDAFALSLESGGDVEVVDRTLGGTAICDRLDRMREDLRDLQPSAVALEFAGNNITPCMRGPAGPLTGDGLTQKYRDDARTATELFAGAGVRVYWMGAPASAAPEAGDFARVRRGYQAESDRLTFTATLPCLPSEGAGDGCVDGRIPVRALDGLHLCPMRTSLGDNRCPVYSSGAARFGLAMAGPIRRDLGL